MLEKRQERFLVATPTVFMSCCMKHCLNIFCYQGESSMLLGLSKPLGKSGVHEQEECGTRSRCLTELQYSMMILHLAAKYVPSKQDKIMEHYSCTTIRILCIIDRAHSHVFESKVHITDQSTTVVHCISVPLWLYPSQNGKRLALSRPTTPQIHATNQIR